METIAYNISGTWTEISFTALGVEVKAEVEFGTHGESRVTLPIAGIPPEIALVIPFEAQCKLYTGRTGSGGSWSGGSMWFQGRRTDNSGQVSGTSVGQSLVIEDAWYDLRFLTLQAAWLNITGFSGSTPTYGTPFTWPDCVLFQFTPAGELQPDGTFDLYSPLPVDNHITTGQSIYEMLSYAIYFGGMNLQIGTLDPACYVPFYPVRSMRIADAIKVALRVHPDCTTEIDYTTTPPTFNIRQQSNLTGVTLPYKGTSSGRTHLTSTVRPRPELVPSRVGIYIKETSNIDGNDVVSYGTDFYPTMTPSGLRSMDASVDMTGPKIATTVAKLTVAAFDPTSLAWWEQKVPALQKVSQGGQLPNSGAGALGLVDSTINGGGTHLKGIQVVDNTGAAIDLTDFPNELLTGNICSWMTVSGDPVEYVEATVKAFFAYSKTTAIGSTPTNITDSHIEHPHNVRIKLTNGVSGTYTNTQFLSAGEVYPTGLAEAVYNSLQTLQYNFTHTILEIPLATWIKPGKHCLNLSGGATAWETMNAMIQGVKMELMFTAGGQTVTKTTVSCGPVKHLDVGELIQLINIFTNRDLSKINPNERAKGESQSGGQAQLGDDTPKENSAPAQPLPSVHNVVSVDGSNVINGQIALSAPTIADILAATTPTPVGGANIKLMQPTEIPICDPSTGAISYLIVMATGGYTKP